MGTRRSPSRTRDRRGRSREVFWRFKMTPPRSRIPPPDSPDGQRVTRVSGPPPAVRATPRDTLQQASPTVPRLTVPELIAAGAKKRKCPAIPPKPASLHRDAEPEAVSPEKITLIV